MIKVITPTVLGDIARRAIQVHGALGTTTEMPLMGMLMGSLALGLADGPTEVHRSNLARQVLKGYAPTDQPWPTEFKAYRQEAARAAYGDLVPEVPYLP